MDIKLKPCPFCGGNDVRFSVKTTTINYRRAYHIVMYCAKCHCYGARSLVYHDGHTPRVELGKNEEWRRIAIDAWNRRADDGY